MDDCLDGKHAAGGEYPRSLQTSRMSDSLTMACDFYYDPFCEICAKTRKRNVQHECFCNDCVQFLCKDCLDVHSNLHGTRGHVVRTGNDMPKSMADKPPKFDYCNVHQNSKKDQFCGMHKILLCSQCAPLQHKDCPVKSVDLVCKNILTSEIDVLYHKVYDFKTNISSAAVQIGRNISDLEKQKLCSLKDAQDMKTKLIEQLDKLFEEISSEIKSTYTVNASNLSCGQNKLNYLTVSLADTLDELDKLKGKIVDTKTFLTVQDILKDVNQCKIEAKKLTSSTVDVNISFIPAKWMNEFLSTSNKMDSISAKTTGSQVAISVPEISFPVSPDGSSQLPQGHSFSMPFGESIARKMVPLSQIKAKKDNRYNVKLSGDNICLITGMAVTNDGRRLLADNNNSAIKMYSRDMKFVCLLFLATKPWDIAVTGDREAIVSCNNERKLLILNVSDSEMSVKTTVELPFIVGGIAKYKNKLLVSCGNSLPATVKMIDQSGKVYWSTEISQQGQEMFSRPNYVTCYDDGGSGAAIVSDDNNSVLAVLNAETGDKKARLHLKGKGPRGVATDAVGNIFVCNYSENQIALLAKDLSRQKVLLSERDGLGSLLLATVYNATDHQLLVSYDYGGYCNVVDCFNLQ